MNQLVIAAAVASIGNEVKYGDPSNRFVVFSISSHHILRRDTICTCHRGSLHSVYGLGL